MVVYSSNRDTLQIYINDKKATKAKPNRKNYATFNKVKLSGVSKLTFAKSKALKQDVRVSYVKYVTANGAQVSFSSKGPKHSFKEFYEWSTSERYDALMAPIGSAYQQIMAACGNRDRGFGPVWTTCMQEGYKDYLKPETFADGVWQGDYTAMVGFINDAQSQHALHGDLSVNKSERYKKDMREAQKLYEGLAATN